MSVPADQLLRALGGGVRPIDSGASSRYSLEHGTDFGALLERARSGNPETGLPVKLTGVLDQQLDHEQRAALAAAVDRVAVVGGETALILLDERTLRVDVRTRTVIGEIEQAESDPVVGIDSYVRAENSGTDGTMREIVDPSMGLLGSARVVRNASLVRALSSDAPRTA